MAYLSGRATLTYTDLYASFTEVPGGLNVGHINDGPAGKMFRLGLIGGVALVAGNLLQAAAEDTQFENMAVLATAIASSGSLQTANITNGTTTITANQFDGGSVAVTVTPDLGREYTIMGHTTGGSGAALTVTLDRPLGTAWTTSTKVNMKRSPWSGVIQFPVTTQTEMPVGVAVYALASAAYGFLQTHGVASALSDNSTFAVGSALSPSLAVAGAVGVNVAGTTHCNVGIARQANATGKCISVFLQID